MQSRYSIVFSVVCVFLLGMLCILGFGLHDVFHGWQSTRWPQVSGTVTQSEVKTRQTSSDTRVVGSEKRTPAERNRSDAKTVFFPFVQYEYVISGRKYEGSRITISDGIDSDHPGVAASVIARYPAGSTVTVYHHPTRGELTVLEPGISEGATAQSIIGLTFSLAFGGLLLFVLSKRGREVIRAFTSDEVSRQRTK